MAIELSSLLDVLEDSYSAYYNISKENLPEDLPLAFRADYFQRGEKYWISKSIPIWGNETNEYAYVFSAKSFDEEMIEKCIAFALDEALPRVKPHKEHQYSNVKTIFVADDYKGYALQKVRKSRFSKSYNHSLWGYSELLTCAVDADSEKVVVNPAGRDMTKYFKKLFAAQHKG